MCDLRYAFWTLLRTPSVTGTATVALALGIGANSAIFSVIYASLIYGASPSDPIAFAGTSTFLIAVAVLAAWMPARRAAAVDPATALRSL